MTHREVIEDYVGDVIRHLPHDMQSDVGFELRELLADSLAERARVSGQPIDDAMVLALLREFGHPESVAARYQPTEMVILPASQTRAFIRNSLIGIALQWALTLPGALSRGSLGGWWLSWGLGALWWPGALIMGAAASAWWQRETHASQAWQPRSVDRERVDRQLTTFGLVAFAVGVTIMLALPLFVQMLPDAAAETFEFAPEFLGTRASLILPLWVIAFGLRLQALRAGRWSAGLRNLRVLTDVAVVVLLLWWSFGGPVFRLAATDTGAKSAIGLVILAVVFDLASAYAQRRPTIHPPNVAR